MKQKRINHKRRKPLPPKDSEEFVGPYYDNDGNRYRDIHDLIRAGCRYFWSRNMRTEPRLQKTY